MKLKCSQMEILLSFYIENELSPCLKQQFEEHLKNCEACAEKFEMVKGIISDIKESATAKCIQVGKESLYSTDVYQENFKKKISEYLDNELPDEENIKIKKLAITNKLARKELEDSYTIRRLMSESYKKTKSEAKQDFAKSIIKQLEFEEEIQSGFNPAIKLLIFFTVTVIVIATLVLFSLNT